MSTEPEIEIKSISSIAESDLLINLVINHLFLDFLHHHELDGE